MQSIQLLSDSNYIRLVALDLNSKDIISEQVCLREYQIFGAKTLIVGLLGGLGEWTDSGDQSYVDSKHVFTFTSLVLSIVHSTANYEKLALNKDTHSLEKCWRFDR